MRERKIRLVRAGLGIGVMRLLLGPQPDLVRLIPVAAYRVPLKVGIVLMAGVLGSTAIREGLRAMFGGLDRQAAVIWRNLATWTLYLVPTANEMPELTLDRTVTPSPINELGVKGVGEAGTFGHHAAPSRTATRSAS